MSKFVKIVFGADPLSRKSLNDEVEFKLVDTEAARILALEKIGRASCRERV